MVLVRRWELKFFNTLQHGYMDIALQVSRITKFISYNNLMFTSKFWHTGEEEEVLRLKTSEARFRGLLNSI